jgi:peptidoglycan biosynthesis protein MviN/MurJ (putative lipid II flippase)
MSTMRPAIAVTPTPQDGTAKRARAGLAMSLATFAMAAASAIQAVLYLSRFGTSGRTDGFFVAFALYTTFGVFCQSLRLTSVPLLVEPGARMTMRQFTTVLGLIALPVLIACIPLADPLARLLAPGLSAADRAVTESALPVLGAAMVLQLWAAGAATVLAIRDRFTAVAASYIAGAGAGLVTYVGLVGTARELTLGWSMVAMALVTCGGMVVGVQTSGGLGRDREPVRLARMLSDAGLVLGRTGVYLAFNVLFVVTLSFASKSAAGDSTVLSYAYLFASYLVAGTGMALGMSRIPDMTRAARTERQAVIEETVPQGFRYAMLLVAPALAGLVSAGAPLIHGLFPGSLDAAGVSTLRSFGALLVPWTVAALLVSFLLPALFAVGRAGLLNALAVPLVLVHLAATFAGERLGGAEGAVAAFWVAPSIFAAILLAAGAGPGATRILRHVATDSARFLALAAVAFGCGEAASAAAGNGTAGALLAAVVGSGLYVAGMWLVARRQLTVLLAVVRPAPAAA